MTAPTFFGVGTNPADNGSLAEPVTGGTLTPPASMLAGDLVIIRLYNENGSAGDGLQLNNTGGQTWTSDTTNGSYSFSGSAAGHRIYWCTFNGTWSGGNPTWDAPSKTGTRGAGAQMLVFRPDSTSKVWEVDTALSWASFSAPSTPFTVTVTGLTPAHADTVTLAGWCSDDDNTWGTLSGTGWSKTGLAAQYRNTGGSDLSTTYAYNLKGTASATNNVSQNQATLGGDAGATFIVCFYATSPTTTINATPGNATAAGTTAAITIDISVNTTVGDAAADGTTATITNDPPGGYFGSPYYGVSYFGVYFAPGPPATSDVTIYTTTGNAVADGTQAVVSNDIEISTTTGDAAADGVTASITTDVTVDATPGDAAADGVTAAVDIEIGTTTGDAVADGITASLSSDVVINATVGDAAAAGVTASITIDVTINTTTGDAAADGTTATVTNSGGSRTALSFPSNGDSPSEFVAMYLSGTDLPDIVPLTIIDKYYPKQQTGYYTKFFHGHGDGSFTGDEHYFGTHPYPVGGASGTVHNWEVSALGGDDIDDENSNDTTVVKDQWYDQASVAQNITGDGSIDYYWDLGTSINRWINKTFSGFTLSNSSNSPKLTYGDTWWNQQNERLSGYVRGIQIYQEVLSTTHIAALSALETDAEVLAYCSTNSITSLWYLNMNPTASDITDKSGNGHDMVWANASYTADTYVLPDDVTIDTAPGNAAADGVQAVVSTDIIISTTTGNAAADGVTASISTDVTINTAPGNAAADGVTASISTDVTVDATPGDAVADGVTASISTDVTINATPGNAAADGVTASISTDVTIDTTPGNAAADGVTASLSTDVTVDATPGNAAADGVTAAVDIEIGTTTGNAVADGVSAVIEREGAISTITGDAVADGVQALIEADVTIDTTTGDAAADGVTAIVSTDITIDTTPGNAAADGVQASIEAEAVVLTTTGNAVADGVLALVEADGVIFTTTGDAIADGVTAIISTDVTIGTTTGDAVADGVTASLSTDVSIETTTGDAAADGVQASIEVEGAILTTTGNAVADGVTASIDVTVTVDTSPGNAVADGIAASISTDVSIDTTTGNAAADGVSASISADTEVSATPGDAVADGVTAQVGNSVTINCTPGNATAAGATAVVDTHITIEALVGNAAADGILAQIFGSSLIATTPGNAIADGVKALIGIAPLAGGTGLAPTEQRRRARQRTIPTPEERAIIRGVILMREQGRDGIDITGDIVESDEQIFKARKRRALMTLMKLS